MVVNTEDRSRNGHVLVWDQPGLNGNANDPHYAGKPESKYPHAQQFIIAGGGPANFVADEADYFLIRQVCRCCCCCPSPDND